MIQDAISRLQTKSSAILVGAFGFALIVDRNGDAWKEFKLALKLRDQFERPRIRSRIDISAVERALGNIWSLLNTLHADIYGSRWA